MKNKIKISVFAVFALSSFIGCSRDLDSQDDEKNNFVAERLEKETAKDSNAKTAGNPLIAFYSHLLQKHYYSTGNFLPSYSQERILGYLPTMQITAGNNSPYVTIWYNETNGDSYITPYANEIVGSTVWTKKEMLGHPVYEKPSVPVYEYYRGSSQSHFYTTSLSELGYGKDGWVFNGPRFYVNVY
jgi:hypothetical protein